MALKQNKRSMIKPLPRYLACAYVTAHLRSDLRRNFIFANVLLWSAGAWFYLAVPALGPCYATPEILDPIRAEMPGAVNTQAALFAHYTAAGFAPAPETYWMVIAGPHGRQFTGT